MKLFLVHCGFYDQSLAEEGRNIFEGHHNFYTVAEDAVAAKAKIKEKVLFKEKKMHVDGIHQIDVVDGYRVGLQLAEGAQSEITSKSYEESKLL